jgi:prevent-host-death family protein
MVVANIHQAKTNLSKLIEQAEAGEEVVIARNGKPAVRLTPIQPPKKMSKAEILESFRLLNVGVKDDSPAGWSHVDAFLAEKHLEGFWENGHVTNDERNGWLERLERNEVWPQQIEDFLAERASRG